MILTNPFTGQIINSNPKGCNQYSGPECTGFHGTGKKFKKFSEGRHQRTPGFWFNTSPRVAGMYVPRSGEGRLIKAKFKLGKTAPEGTYERLVEHFEGSRGIPYNYLLQGAGESDNGFVKAETRAIRSLRKAGYNSIMSENPEGGLDYVVMKPGQISTRKVYKRKQK